MKTYTLLLCLIIFSCSVERQVLNNKNALYFYFDAKNKIMKKNHSGYDVISNKGIDLKYNYRLDSINVIFVGKNLKTRNNPKRKRIKQKDFSNIDLKDFQWLNEYTSNWKNIVKLRNYDNDMYIIERDTLDNKYYLVNVVYIEEVD